MSSRRKDSQQDPEELIEDILNGELRTIKRLSNNSPDIETQEDHDHQFRIYQRRGSPAELIAIPNLNTVWTTLDMWSQPVSVGRMVPQELPSVMWDLSMLFPMGLKIGL